MGHHHPDGLGIVDNRNLYAADVHFFELFVHLALTWSQYCESRHMGLCRHSISMTGYWQQLKTGVFSRNPGHFVTKRTKQQGTGLKRARQTPYWPTEGRGTDVGGGP
jgi:hypothetical protein